VSKNNTGSLPLRGILPVITSATASSTDMLSASERKVQRTSDRRGQIPSKFADSRLHEPGQKQTQLETTGVDVTLEDGHPRPTDGLLTYSDKTAIFSVTYDFYRIAMKCYQVQSEASQIWNRGKS